MTLVLYSLLVGAHTLMCIYIISKNRNKISEVHVMKYPEYLVF